MADRKGKWIVLVLLLAAALVLLRMLGPGGAPPPSVTGRILRIDGTPAPGAVAEAVFETGDGAKPLSLRSPSVGADGRFTVAGAPAEWTSLRIRVRRGPLDIEADLGPGQGPVDLDLRLPGTFKVAGLVVASDGGRPLPGMTVRLGTLEALTDELGRFTFPDLPASMADRAPPVLEVSGKRRRPLRRAVPFEQSVDDLLLYVDPE
jgi:hypothetical protein